MSETHQTPGRAGKRGKVKVGSGVAQALSKGWWQGIGAIAGVLALAGAAAAVLALIPSGQHGAPRTADSPMHAEQAMISRLSAGDDYAKLLEIIGTEPDLHQTLKSGATVYQFNRPWEYIDLTVSNGRVLSVALYAKTTTFRATLSAGGYKVTLNGGGIAEQTRPAAPAGAVAECDDGDTPNYYLEGYSLPMTYELANVALGWVSSTVAIRGTAAATVNVPYIACSPFFRYSPRSWQHCSNLDTWISLSSSFYYCLYKAGFNQQADRLSPSAVIVTAPGQSITPEMVEIIPAPFGLWTEVPTP